MLQLAGGRVSSLALTPLGCLNGTHATRGSSTVLPSACVEPTLRVEQGQVSHAHVLVTDSPVPLQQEPALLC